MADEDFTPEELELLDEMIADLKAINQRMTDMIERDRNRAARFNQLMAQMIPSTTPLNGKTQSISNIASAGEKNSCTELVLIDLTPLKPSPSKAESTMVMEQKDDQLEDLVEESLDLVHSKREVHIVEPLNNGGLVADMGDQLLQPFVQKNQQTMCTSSNFVPGVFISNQLLDLYTKCGSLVDAQKVFDEMSNRDLCPHWVIMAGLDSIEPLLAQINEHQLMMLTPVAPRLPPKPPDVSYGTMGSIQLLKKLNIDLVALGDYFALGAVFSATDSVCTLQVIDRNETHHLHSLVFGEGVVHDATSVVLFNAIQKFDLLNITPTNIMQFIGNFLYLFLTSTLLGVAVGLFSAYLIKKLYFGRHSTDREIALMILMAYFSYMLAELLDLSGIITVFFCGIVMSHYTWHNVTENSRITSRHAFVNLSLISEIFIFLYVGMDALDMEKWRITSNSPWTLFGTSAILISLVLLGRAAFVFPLSFIANLFRKSRNDKIAFKQLIWVGNKFHVGDGAGRINGAGPDAFSSSGGKTFNVENILDGEEESIINKKTKKGVLMPSLLGGRGSLFRTSFSNTSSSSIHGKSEKYKMLKSDEVQCTVLEVKIVEGHGTTIDVVLVNGVLHEGDQVVVCGMQSPIVTTIRALLTPHPMKELRVKGTYLHHKEINAAIGIKITAQGLENAIAGTALYVVKPGNDVEDFIKAAENDMNSVMSRIDRNGEGVCVQASTLGSLEALLEFLKTPVVNIPVSGISIGPVQKKYVMKASVMLENKREYATILAIDVKVTPEARELADELGVKVFIADIIYHLFDQFKAYIDNIKEEKKREAADEPCVLKILPNCVFNKKDPIVLGVDILEGILKEGVFFAIDAILTTERSSQLMYPIFSGIQLSWDSRQRSTSREALKCLIGALPSSQSLRANSIDLLNTSTENGALALHAEQVNSILYQIMDKLNGKEQVFTFELFSELSKLKRDAEIVHAFTADKVNSVAFKIFNSHNLEDKVIFKGDGIVTRRKANSAYTSANPHGESSSAHNQTNSIIEPQFQELKNTQLRDYI